jgi:DNA invertase Pin-like site-specific DNA recombinase
MARTKGSGLKNLKELDDDDKTALDERSFEDWLKATNKPVSYLRVSTTKQEGTLPTQQKDVAEKSKKLGLKRIKYFSEQGSGKNNPFREELTKMIQYAVEEKRKGNSPVIVLRDIQRLARDPYDIGYIYKYSPTLEDSLWSNDIPLMALNERIVTGTKNFKSMTGDFLAPLFINIGGQEVATRTKQTRAAVKAARDKGILAGTPINLYFKDKLNPLRELDRYLRAGDISQAEMARRIGRSKSWVRDTKMKFAEIRNKHPLGEVGFQKWLDVSDLVRNMEKEFGSRSGTGATKRMIAVGRMTSGYFARPYEFDAPTQDDLNEYYENFKLYQPKRR